MSITEAIINNLNIPIVAIDNDGNIIDVNAAARHLLPSSNHDKLGESAETVFPEWLPILTMIRSNQTPHGFYHEVPYGHGKTARAVVAPIPDIGWSIVLHDVTEYKEAANAKNNALGEIAHDLKQPLTAISGYADIVQASGAVNERQKQYLMRIRNAALRMTDQVLQLLDVVWIESGMTLTLVEVDLVGITHQILEELEERGAAKQIRFVVEAADDLPYLVADHLRMTQVVANLLSNAMKYSNDGGTVTTKIELDGDGLCLSVTDEGIGIDAQHLTRVFDRFYRVKDHHTQKIEGTGLGLYITRSIVEQHAGTITVDSVPGAGSTFSVWLPLPKQSLTGKR